jgi:hypothetical protein
MWLPVILASIVVLHLGESRNGAVQASTTQPQTSQRKIVSDYFAKNRKPAPQPSGSPSQSLPLQSRTRKREQPRTYTLVSKQVKKPGRMATAQIRQLGVTIWKLRPVTASDAGTPASNHGPAKEWETARVQGNTKLKAGDLVRLSIESAHPGYLYVINQEVFADGTRSKPRLIYPWSGLRNGDNWVRPGTIVDIPSAGDQISYFTAKPKLNQAGELLTIIVSKSPLNVEISDPPAEVPLAQFVVWERSWRRDVEQYELDGGAGEAWTEKEQLAASRTRRRELTREDPGPQTIYQINAANKRGYLIGVRLEYSQ